MMSEQSERGVEDELRIEFERHQEQIRTIAAEPHSHWTLNLIAEDERHYGNVLKLLKRMRTQPKAQQSE
jgi:hypothetical protein